jgi:hypothetical protein
MSVSAVRAAKRKPEPIGFERFEAAQHPEPPIYMRAPCLDPRDKSRKDELAQRPVEDDVGGEPQIRHGLGAPEHKPLADRRKPLQIRQELFLTRTEAILAQTRPAAVRRAACLVVADKSAGIRPMHCFREHSLSIVGKLSLIKRKIPI